MARTAGVGSGAGDRAHRVLPRRRRAGAGAAAPSSSSTTWPGSHRRVGAPPLDVALGFYEVWRNHLYNSALYASLGGTDAGIRHVHRKVFLPTYGVFDEERFVEPGRSVQAFDTRWGRAAMLICEDAWHSHHAHARGARWRAAHHRPERHTGARAACRGRASPAPANLDRWDRLAQDIAEEHGVYVVVAQLVGFEGGKGFAGGSIVAGPAGRPAAAGAPLRAGDGAGGDLDLDEITRARADSPLLSDLEIRLPHLAGELSGSSDGADQAATVATDRTDRAVGPRCSPSRPDRARPPSPSAPAGGIDPLAIDPELTRRWLVEFIATRSSAGASSKKVVDRALRRRRQRRSWPFSPPRRWARRT